MADTPKLEDLFANPDFRGLPGTEKIKVLEHYFPDYAELPLKEKVAVISKGLSPEVAKEKEGPGFLRTLGNDAAAIPGAAYNIIRHPMKTGEAIGEDMVDTYKKGQKTGVASGIPYKVASALPVIGPAAVRAGEELGEGKIGAGLAHTAELLGPFAGKAAAGTELGKASMIAAKTGASALGKVATSPLVKMGAHLAHPGLGEGISMFSKITKLFSAASKEAPVAATAKVAKGGGTSTKFGGRFEPDLRKPGTIIPRKGYTPPKDAPPSAIEAPKPFRPKPGVVKKFGGTTDPGYSPARPTTRGKYTPPTPPSPQPVGRAWPAGVPKPTFKGGGIVEEEPVKAAPEAIPQSTPKFSPEVMSKPKVRTEGQSVVVRNNTLARLTHEAGISSSDAENFLSSENWAHAAKQMGSPAPNKAGIKSIIAGIKKLETKK